MSVRSVSSRTSAALASGTARYPPVMPTASLTASLYESGYTSPAPSSQSPSSEVLRDQEDSWPSSWCSSWPERSASWRAAAATYRRMQWPRSVASSSLRRRSTSVSPTSRSSTPARSPTRPPIPTDYKLFQQDVLEYMITYELASQAAADLKITVTDADVQTEIDKIVTEHLRRRSDRSSTKPSSTQGMTLDQLKRSYKESMLLQKVYDEVTKGVTTVPDADIQAYYDAHKTDYFVAETRTARHILLTPAAGRVDATTSTSAATTTTTAATGTQRHDHGHRGLDHHHRRADGSRLGFRAGSGQTCAVAAQGRRRLDYRSQAVLRRSGLQGDRWRPGHHLQGRDGPGVRGRRLLAGEGR